MPTDEERLAVIEAEVKDIRRMLVDITDLLNDFKPILNRYKAAANANNFRQARKALKESNHG